MDHENATTIITGSRVKVGAMESADGFTHREK
jgi:hypothetical protein